MLLALVAGAAAIVALDIVDVPAAVPAALAASVLWFALGYAFLSVAFAVGDVATWESGVAVAIMVVATYGLVRLAAAVYVGELLRTGERPRLRDLRDAVRTR
jgi:hypothetical protein